ncbi:MAG: sulfatase-like hydrolase/transferase [Planctomycetota bacterium]
MTGFTRRAFIRTAGGFVSAATLGSIACSAQAQEQKRLNILFLMTDQHDPSVMGCSGNPVVKTPTLDNLAADGVRFTNALCSTPFCSPTRASLVTGLWPHTHGIVRNVDGDKEKKGLTDEATTTEQILFDKGYETFHLGKWHLGPTTDLRCYRKDPANVAGKAYNQFLKAAPKEKWHTPRDGEEKIGEVCYIPEMAAFHKAWQDEKRKPQQDVSIIGRSLRPAEYTYEWWLADRCIELIKKYKDQNFMITWSVSPPHALHIAPDPYYSMYDPARVPFPKSWDNRPEVYQTSVSARMGTMMGEKGVREYLRCYYGQVTLMDELMGRILAALKEAGLDSSTLVLFTADHGDMQGAHGMVEKSVGAYYEQIVRVPFIMRYPAIKPGTVIQQHVDSVDVMPTLLEFAGMPVSKDVQGRSVKSLVEGKTAEDDRPGFCERGKGEKATSRMIRTKRWKYSYFVFDQRRELFDLEADPDEMTDLAGSAEHKATLADLHRQLRQQMERTADPALDVIPKT